HGQGDQAEKNRRREGRVDQNATEPFDPDQHSAALGGKTESARQAHVRTLDDTAVERGRRARIRPPRLPYQRGVEMHDPKDVRCSAKEQVDRARRNQKLSAIAVSAISARAAVCRSASSTIARRRSNSAAVGCFESRSATITRSRAPSKTRSTNRL